MSQWWSWLLMSIGLVGLFLVGSNYWQGWAINLANQGLWFTYSVYTRQWGFLVACFVYAGMYARNLLKWRRDLQQKEWERHQRPLILWMRQGDFTLVTDNDYDI